MSKIVYIQKSSMKKFAEFTSTCINIKTENIDTDQIVPARFLKITKREGFGKYLFHDWKVNRFDYSNNRSANILVAGNNFGCGSSREHAVWALMDFGFKVVISSSFGDIFYNNSLKNGLLLIILTPSELKKLFKIIEKNPNTKLLVNLISQSVFCNNIIFHFPIDSFRKTCLINGVDELGYILAQEDKIRSFEMNHKIYLNN